MAEYALVQMHARACEQIRRYVVLPAQQRFRVEGKKLGQRQRHEESISRVSSFLGHCWYYYGEKNEVVFTTQGFSQRKGGGDVGIKKRA